MRWTKLPFGKHLGKTLPQIVAANLDWFYYMLPKLRGKLGVEGRVLARRMKAVKIPGRRRRREVEYYDEDGRFNGFRLVKTSSPMHSRGAIRLPHLDMSLAANGRTYAKRECRQMIRCFRVYFIGKNKRLTRKRCEKFFSDADNFLNP